MLRGEILCSQTGLLACLKSTSVWLQSSGGQPLAMAGHTMTLTAEKKIWVIGGFSPFSYFTESVYVLDLNDGGVVWTEVVGQHGTKPVGKKFITLV